MKPEADCITIDCSSDEDEEGDDTILLASSSRPAHSPSDDKQNIISSERSQTRPRLDRANGKSSMQIQEQINSLLDSYGTLHRELSSAESLMNSTQRLRWQRYKQACQINQSPPVYEQDLPSQMPSSSSNDRPNAAGPEEGRPFAWQRPPWFIDPPGNAIGSAPGRATSNGIGNLDVARRPVKRHYKKKRRATAKIARRKSTSATGSSSMARTPRPKASTSTKKSTASTSGSSSSRPKASTSSGDKKPSVSKLRSMLSKVKKEH